MAFNGSGVFLRIFNWVNDAAANIKIRADRMDAEMNGFATGLTNCITKDGQTTITANLPLSGYKFTGGAVATSSTEYATYGQILTSKALPTVGGTADAITIAHTIPYTALYSGMEVSWVASGANTTAVTLAVDGQTAKAVNRSGATALAAGDLPSAEQITARYDGTQFEVISVGGKAPFLHTTNTFAKAMTLSSTLSVTGAITAASTLAVTGATSTGALTTTGAVSATGAINGVASLNIAGNSTAAAVITLAEDTDNGTNKVTITPPQLIASDYTLTLPSTTGTLALTSDLDVKAPLPTSSAGVGQVINIEFTGSYTYTVPAGGLWFVFGVPYASGTGAVATQSGLQNFGIFAGGTTITTGAGASQSFKGVAWRVS